MPGAPSTSSRGSTTTSTWTNRPGAAGRARASTWTSRTKRATNSPTSSSCLCPPHPYPPPCNTHTSQTRYVVVGVRFHLIVDRVKDEDHIEAIGHAEPGSVGHLEAHVRQPGARRLRPRSRDGVLIKV